MDKKGIDLSIIIVGYNAVDFIKLTLDSVELAIKPINAEVLLIDNSNNSTLQKIVKTSYPFVKIIDNNCNLGFAKANNKALRLAKGDRAILLNPDTIVSEDAFVKLIQYCKNHPLTGGIGVKMIDGTGNFLKESKRGFPSLSTSFYKMCGLHKLFPSSEKFAKYYEGHLNHNHQQEVDILAGAFLVIPRDKNNQLTLLDEQYFMYGEDIDLSHRLKLKHGANIYLPDIPIIHFKGQCTIRDQHIVKHFYLSMWLFYKQHIAKNNSLFVNTLTKQSIYLLMRVEHMLSFLKKFIPKSPSHTHIDTCMLISNNKEIKENIQQALNKPVGTALKPNRRSKKELIIFDLNFIPSKDIIAYMDENVGFYGFLTKDYTSMVINVHPSQKGQVIDLQ
ncbi:MAG: glycosyltransferase family 2 protein [Carboxylicivirga sp.]|jgi:GT2 family glycosyltransferase|nr:glycosyltransferase family 2 protein [Carboxylicivirga sp.]